MKIIKILCVFLIFMGFYVQIANAGIWKKIGILVPPAITLVSWYAYRAYAPFIPNSIVDDLSIPSRLIENGPPLPPYNHEFKIQGGWSIPTHDGNREIGIDCRNHEKDTCVVYFNCPACVQGEIIEKYKGQAKIWLGEIKRTGTTGPNGINESYKGKIYDTEEYIKGNLVKREVSMVTHWKGTMPVVYYDPKKTKSRVRDEVWYRSSKSEWNVTPSYIK